MEQLRGRFGVEFVLRVLGVASSTYHGWVARQAAPSRREREDRAITAEIADIHIASGRTYGSPRVHQILRRRGVRVSRKRVGRLMRQAGL
ncbi:IS3 family transposase [Saccharothrix syringae]|uniref:IS3 family transposase n=1 Tax=Saccharothrix syringae TaxID=103733 RepID=UPI000B233759|nr:IS3 family transposase [Saccharothrix syringae]